MESPTGMARQPFSDLGMFVGGVVVEDGMDDFAGRNVGLDGVEKADESLMSVTLHAAANDRAIENVQGSKQCRRAIALIVMGECPASSWLYRQARLGAVEGLNLGLLID